MIFKRTLLKKMKERASHEKTPVKRIYDEEIAEAASSVNSAVGLPEFDCIHKVLYKARNLEQPALPKSVDDIVWTERYTKTKDGKDFLLGDDGSGEDRLLMFCTTDNLKRMCSSKKIWADGTFKIVPLLFHQLYTIHGLYENEMFPFVYCLLQDKKKETYKRLFQMIKEEAGKVDEKFSPENAMLDFELAAINALREEVPNVSVKGCFFHYTQNIWKKVQNLGLVPAYKHDPKTYKWIRRIASLPLVHSERSFSMDKNASSHLLSTGHNESICRENLHKCTECIVSGGYMEPFQ
ncbi:uncharacterized protein [Parasteatoda tepidariorum]|uniref:uncharacterized protein n=1 Tax=Parasteatoda tepidariorum TaxID=114398 RepID=UPI0039BCD636